MSGFFFFRFIMNYISAISSRLYIFSTYLIILVDKNLNFKPSYQQLFLHRKKNVNMRILLQFIKSPFKLLQLNAHSISLCSN